MKVPLSWLREFIEVTVEPGRLGEDLTLAGFALDGLESDGKDAVLDLDVTTNRVDCMNVYGLAREVAVLYGLPLRPLERSLAEKGPAATQVLEVGIEAPDLCPRFSARVLDVRPGPSPAWIRDRLESVGVRPIHNVVDLTNYVMMEMGHPSHAFAARALGMHTEASHRFERGADPEATVTALDRIAHLLAKIGAGTARPGVVDRVAVPRAKRTVSLRPARVRAVLGVDVPQPKADAILSGLGFRVQPGMAVEVPSWRSDVGREADLIEEVGRHFGLDKIPSSIPPTDARGGLGLGQAEERTVRATLVAAGLTEAMTYSFVGAPAGTRPPKSPE